MGIDQWRDFAVNLRLRQRLDDDAVFPCAVALDFPVLDRTTAADAKMLAKWGDPLRACALDGEQPPPIGMMTRHRRNLDRLAAERIRHIDGLAIGKNHAVAAMADVIDDKTLNHSGRRGRIQCCRRRP